MHKMTLGLCAVLANPSMAAGAPASSPAPTKPGALVQSGPYGGVTCPRPAPAKTARAKGKLPPAGSAWQIHANGVGEIWVGEGLPASVSQREGGSPTEAFMKRIEKLDSNEALNQGLLNQAGYPVIGLKTLEIRLSFAQEWRVLSIETGPSIQTPNGTGKGSSLAEIKKAHGGISLHQGPEPYHCVATVPDIRFVGFFFSNCKAACAGERSLQVTAGKARYDFREQKWLQKPMRPSKEGKKPTGPKK